jgi:16S rRNA (guanine(527)-N(7))-methyltransferase RsmG
MFHVEHFGEIVSTCLAEYVHLIGLRLTQTQSDQFAKFADELSSWNQKINLTAITEPREIAIKHFLDSLFGVLAISSHGVPRLVDVGSGGGFPGIPLKIMMPSLPLSIVEPNGKKASFLLHLVGLLRLGQVIVVNSKIEDVSCEDHRLSGPRSIVVRGLKIEDRLGLLSSLLDEGERLILYGTGTWSPHMAHPQFKLLDQIPYQLPLGLGDRMLVVLEKGQKE